MARSRDLPITRNLGLLFIGSLVIAAGIAAVSVAGIVARSDLYGTDPPLVLVSPGGDAANLVVIVPALLASVWLARRGSLISLLLWPGALFYALYISAVFLVGAPLGPLLFAYVGLVVLSASSLMVTVASIDAETIRRRFTTSRVRVVGGALVVLGVAAYAGLAATAISEFGRPADEVVFRPQWVVDCALGTPPLLAGGLLAWFRRPLGAVVAAGLLFTSGLGGLAFAVAAWFDDLLSGGPIDVAVVVVHSTISAVSFGLLAWFLGAASTMHPPAHVNIDPRPSAARADRQRRGRA